MFELVELRSLNTEASSVGVIQKWYHPTKNLYIKASSFIRSSKIYHTEAITECIASEVGKLLNVYILDYVLDTVRVSDLEDITVCVSKDYTQNMWIRDVISARALLLKMRVPLDDRRARYDAIINTYPDLRPKLDAMIVFDYLINNYDRHLRNFEFCSFYEGSVDLSPLYDNGSSLLSDFHTDIDLADLMDEDYFDEYVRYAQTPTKAFAHEHNIELRLVNKDIFNRLNLNIPKTDFEFILHKYSNLLSQTRLDLIYKLLTTRYDNILRYAKSE